MQQLEPTYLRYVYDGLSKGSISSNNPTSLPIGFIGLFEDEFSSSMPLSERMSLLNRLAIWALLNGPVSIEMVAEILNEDSDSTKSLVDKYSKWFNSPEPGKYVLYHDRLRTYLLQKLSDYEVQDLNEILISYLKNSLSDEQSIEAESYALEHLSTHMLVESHLDNNYERLNDFVNNEDLWKRQVRASNEYKWSQRAVQYGIKEGARRHDEIKTITSTVNSVKLSQDEQNNTEQIINFLNSGDYETALKRSEAFKGEKLMTIYLLMLHDLTIGKSNKSSFRNKACELIISSIRNEKSAISNYSLYAIYQYEFELFKIGIDDCSLFKNFMLDGHQVHNKLKTVLIRLLEYPLLDYEFHEALMHKCLAEIDFIDLYVLRASKLFKQKQNKIALKNIEIATNRLENLNFSSFPHGYMNFGIEESNEKYYIEYLGYIIKWCFNISELYAINNHKELSLKYLNEAVININKINPELVQKSNSAQLQKGLYGEDKIWQFNIYRNHSRLSKLYLLNDDFDKLLELSIYKSSEEFSTFISEDYQLNPESINDISFLYKYEIEGIYNALMVKGDDYFNQIYSSIKTEGNNYKFVKSLMLLEKLKFTHKKSNNKIIKNDLNLVLDLIKSFPNNTFRLNIYNKVYNLLFRIDQKDTALELLEESYAEISGIWSDGENLKKFFSVVQENSIKVYEALYNFVDKKRATYLLNFVIESTLNHENYKTKNKIFHNIIESLVKLRDKPRLNNFLDFLKNNDYKYVSSHITLRGNGENFKEASLISTSSLQKHVFLLIQENFYEEATSLVKKYNINLDNNKYNFSESIYPIDWDTFHLLKIDDQLITNNEHVVFEYNKKSTELHDFFKIKDLIEFHENFEEIIKLDKVLNRLLFSSESYLFKNLMTFELSPKETIELNGLTYMSYINTHGITQTNYSLTLEELIYKDLSQDYSIDNSLRLMKCFDFGMNLDKIHIFNSENKYERSPHLRKIIFDTYKDKFNTSIKENNPNETEHIFNKLIDLIENTDLGSGEASLYGKYNFNAQLCFDFALFFFDLDNEKYCFDCINKCVKHKKILNDFNNLWLNIHERYSTKQSYIDKITEIYDEIISKEYEIIDEGGKTTMDLIELNTLLRLDKLGKKEMINIYKNQLLDISQKTKFQATDDKENFISELSKFFFKIGDFDNGQIIYDMLSEQYLNSIISSAPNIKKINFENSINNADFQKFQKLYKSELKYFNEILGNSSINATEFNKFFINITSVLELMLVKDTELYKIILLDFKFLCVKFIDQYQNKTDDGYEYSLTLRFSNLIYIFDGFLLINEYNLADETLALFIEKARDELDLMLEIEHFKTDLEIIYESFERIGSKNDKISDLLKSLKKENNNKVSINYQKYFSETNQLNSNSYQLICRQNNLNYDSLSQLLIHYCKIQIFYNINIESLKVVAQVIDFSNWLDIKSKVGQLQTLN